MTLADFTCAELCAPAPAVCGLESALFELSQRLQDKLVVPSPLACFNAALNQCYPGEGDLVGCIAHRWARMASVQTTVFATARTAAFAWRPDTTPVTLVMLVAAPLASSARDLALLAGIGRLAGDATALRALRAAPGARAMFDVFAQIPVVAPPAPHVKPTRWSPRAAADARTAVVTPRPTAGGTGRAVHPRRER